MIVLIVTSCMALGASACIALRIRYITQELEYIKRSGDDQREFERNSYYSLSSKYDALIDSLKLEYKEIPSKRVMVKKETK